VNAQGMSASGEYDFGSPTASTCHQKEKRGKASSHWLVPDDKDEFLETIKFL
jgi:hypothetical protein